MLNPSQSGLNDGHQDSGESRMEVHQTPAQIELEASVLRATAIVAPRMRALCAVDETVMGDGVKIKLRTITGPRGDQEARKNLERIEIMVSRATGQGDKLTQLSFHTLSPLGKVSLNGTFLTDKSADMPLVIALLDKIDDLKRKSATPVMKVANSTGDELREVLGRL